MSSLSPRWPSGHRSVFPDDPDSHDALFELHVLGVLGVPESRFAGWPSSPGDRSKLPTPRLYGSAGENRAVVARSMSLDGSTMRRPPIGAAEAVAATSIAIASSTMAALSWTKVVSE
jgi:hypothetical protein